ncbi:MAG: LCP family protein [Anaerolineae bacterium]|nr:LCP family protein [Anaerolineae bacterium]
MKSKSPGRRSPARIRFPLWVWGIIAGIGLILLLAVSMWLFRAIQGAVSSFDVVSADFNDTAVAPSPPQTGQTLPGAPSVVNSPEESSLISSEGLQPWTGTERISILLLGIDQRCDETGPTHTDSIMIVTIDPLGLSAGVLSLPRDMWVEIPGFGADRINQAHYLGEAFEYPGGGPALAVETVEGLLGVPIQYYLTVNFDAFVEMVDLIGGIEIEVPEAIDDPTYPDRCYGYDPFSIAAGTHQLDGQQALKYARTRATFGGDVDRAGRQQAVVLAVRDKVLQLENLPGLLAQAPLLWQTFQNNVRTNMTVDEALQLALLVKEIPAGSIHTAVINYNYVYNEVTPDGRAVLVPIRENIRQLRDQLFTPPIIPTPVIENLPALMAAENARVAVHNGTAVFGLAGATQEYLQQYGLNVAEVGNADSSAYLTSQVVTYGQFPSTVRYLTQLMHIPPLNVSDSTTPAGDFDVLVIIGDDWRVPGSEEPTP